MNPVIKDKWIAALRSGQFIQGVGLLNNGRGKFCCLGVLCELAAESGITKRAKTTIPPVVSYGLKFPLEQTTVLPAEVNMWAELDDTWVTINGRHANLADHNDRGATFEEIAKAIEEQL